MKCKKCECENYQCYIMLQIICSSTAKKYYSSLESKPPKKCYIMHLKKHVNWSKLKSQQYKRLKNKRFIALIDGFLKIS